MRRTLFRGAALASSVGVAVLVATGGRACGPTTAPTAASAEVSATAASVTAPAPSVPPVPPPDSHGLFGPSTKADPHAIRRAVVGLVSGQPPPTPPPPPSAAPR